MCKDISRPWLECLGTLWKHPPFAANDIKPVLYFRPDKALWTSKNVPDCTRTAILRLKFQNFLERRVLCPNSFSAGPSL